MYQDVDGSLVAYFQEDGRWWFVAVKATGNDELYMTTYHRREERHARRAGRRLRRIR